MRESLPSLPDFTSSRQPIATDVLRSCVPTWMTTPEAFAVVYARLSSAMSMAIGFST